MGTNKIATQFFFNVLLLFSSNILISSQFYLCETFVSYSKAFRVLGYSVIACLWILRNTAIAPIYRSIILLNRISLSNFAHCSLPKLATLLGICGAFKRYDVLPSKRKIFPQVSLTGRSHLFRYFCKKSLVLFVIITMRLRDYEFILRCLKFS